MPSDGKPWWWRRSGTASSSPGNTGESTRSVRSPLRMAVHVVFHAMLVKTTISELMRRVCIGGV